MTSLLVGSRGRIFSPNTIFSIVIGSVLAAPSVIIDAHVAVAGSRAEKAAPAGVGFESGARRAVGGLATQAEDARFGASNCAGCDGDMNQPKPHQTRKRDCDERRKFPGDRLTAKPAAAGEDCY